MNLLLMDKNRLIIDHEEPVKYLLGNTFLETFTKISFQWGFYVGN